MSSESEPQAFEIDMTPEPPTMAALGMMRLGFLAALAEFLDNAFDHGAQRVLIDFKGKSAVVIKDDGEGLDNLETLFKLGRHVQSRAQTLGRYGVGFKTAASWIGGTTQVATLSRGTIQSLRIRFAHMKSWHPSAYRLTATPNACREYNVTAPSGLTIECRDYQHKLPNMASLREDLSYKFGPGIRQGRQVLLGLNGRLTPLAPWAFPELEESFTQSDVINGRSYSLTAGVVRAGAPNPRPGFTIAYLHRVILTTADPCGQYGAGRFFAFVELGPEWRLSTHKDSLAEDEHDELVDKLTIVCQPLLARAQDQAHDVSLQDLEQSLTRLAGQLLKPGSGAQVANIKEKRQPGSQSGTHTATGTGGRRQSTKQAQSGRRTLHTHGAHAGIKIQFSEQGVTVGPATVRLFSQSQDQQKERTDHVLLNRSNSFIERCRLRGERMALISTALSYYALALAMAPEDARQKRLPFIESGESVLRIYEQLMDKWFSQLGEEGIDRLLVAV